MEREREREGENEREKEGEREERERDRERERVKVKRTLLHPLIKVVRLCCTWSSNDPGDYLEQSPLFEAWSFDLPDEIPLFTQVFLEATPFGQTNPCTQHSIGLPVL